MPRTWPARSPRRGLMPPASSAYCALPLLLRGFYAVGDARRPLVAAAWRAGDQHAARSGSGLAAGRIGAGAGHGDFIGRATAAARRQLLARACAPLDWRGLAVGAFKATVWPRRLWPRQWCSSATMAPAVESERSPAGLRLATIAGGLAFLAVLWALGQRRAGDALAAELAGVRRLLPRPTVAHRSSRQRQQRIVRRARSGKRRQVSSLAP